MGLAMTLCHAPKALLAVFTAALTLLVGAAAATAPDAFAGSIACEQWGKASPSELSNGEARKAILCLVNRKRDNAGLPALDRNAKLQKSAQRHTDKMGDSGCFDHECAGEAALDARLENVDYLTGGLRQWAFGENIAWGIESHGTPESIVDAWMNSAGHRANILSNQFREIGVGFVTGTPSSSGAPGGIYTTDFGLRVG